MPYITIKINKKDYSLEIEGFNFEGTACVKELDEIVDKLGMRVINRFPKGEILRTGRQVKVGK